MEQVSNPSITDIEEWAYSDEDWPDQEWDLFLSWKQEVDLFIKLASDHKCPKRHFFRHMLYYLVGKAIEGGFGEDKEFVIKGYLEKASGINHGDIRAWVKETNRLLKNPESYRHDDWKGGILANYNFT